MVVPNVSGDVSIDFVSGIDTPSREAIVRTVAVGNPNTSNLATSHRPKMNPSMCMNWFKKQCYAVRDDNDYGAYLRTYSKIDKTIYNVVTYSTSTTDRHPPCVIVAAIRPLKSLQLSFSNIASFLSLPYFSVH